MQNDFSLEGLMGFDLKGKTLGVIGTGHIGLHVIRMGIGFGMKVVAFDVKENKFLSEVMGFEYVDFDTLLKKSDIVSLHLPYMPTTRHILNTDAFKKMKQGAILINTSRGGLVETGALIKALDEDRISGAGLDVLEEEEYVLEESRLTQPESHSEHWLKLRTILDNNILLHRENVIYTPHMAFYSKEAVQRILDTTIENIRSFIDGKPIHKVNKI
jgi:D-lactate dehydrogenase